MNKKILYLLNIIIAILFVVLIVYRRALVTRLPKGLYIIENDIINYNLIIVIIIGLSVSLYIIKSILFINKTRITFFGLWSQKIAALLDAAIQDLYTLVVQFIPNNYEKVSKIAKAFYKRFHNISEALFLFILFGIRFVIVLIFLIDIFIFFKFDYMYKALYLLCFSVIIKLLFFVLRDFASNLEGIKSALIIRHEGVDPETNLPLIEFELKDDFQHFDLAYHVQEYLICSKLSGYLKIHDQYADYFKSYFSLIVYILYLMGWLYIIYVNLINFTS